jgi:hypothetical protein
MEDFFSYHSLHLIYQLKFSLMAYFWSDRRTDFSLRYLEVALKKFYFLQHVIHDSRLCLKN